MIKIIYQNLFLPCESLLEKPEGIQLKIDRTKQIERRGDSTRNMKRCIVKMIVVVVKKTSHQTMNNTNTTERANQRTVREGKQNELKK